MILGYETGGEGRALQNSFRAFQSLADAIAWMKLANVKPNRCGFQEQQPDGSFKKVPKEKFVGQRYGTWAV